MMSVVCLFVVAFNLSFSTEGHALVTGPLTSNRGRFADKPTLGRSVRGKVREADPEIIAITF